jgi:hypothetical protein
MRLAKGWLEKKRQEQVKVGLPEIEITMDKQHVIDMTFSK